MERGVVLPCERGRQFWWGRIRELMLALAAAAILAALLFTMAV
ncbi:hypothetical protein [Streptomyces sp. YIM 121038]|nr:hypothetical protein [Streptomyces sp. YIM 121038]